MNPNGGGKDLAVQKVLIHLEAMADIQIDSPGSLGGSGIRARDCL